MLKPAAATAQTELEMVTLDQLVPRDHLLRLIDTHIRFDFIREKCEGLYCANNGRPAIDPVVLFKMLFIGYLFGVRSERRLVREIEVNVAYRWFLGLRLTDKVPDASTLSQNRRRRFAGTGIEQEIFDTIVEQAIRYLDETTPSPHAANEQAVDRYLAVPGQATAFTVGMHTIAQERARAQRELGDRFDLRGFHAAVLENGYVPLWAMQENVTRWIAERRGTAALPSVPVAAAPAR